MDCGDGVSSDEPLVAEAELTIVRGFGFMTATCQASFVRLLTVRTHKGTATENNQLYYPIEANGSKRKAAFHR